MTVYTHIWYLYVHLYCTFISVYTETKYMAISVKKKKKMVFYYNVYIGKNIRIIAYIERFERVRIIYIYRYKT